MRDHQRRYLIEALPALALYVLALATMLLLAPHLAGAADWQRGLVALLPLLPLPALMGAYGVVKCAVWLRYR